MAGTIAGYGDVMLGMGDHLKILPLKIPDASGMFYESQVINAMYWSVGGNVPGVPANPYPAKVLNMSFGVDERPGKEIDHCDEALQAAIFYVRKQGAVLIAAAGNDNRWDHYNAPAACNGTMKIASTGPEALRAYYSNYGPSVSFAAPGGDLHYGKQGGILSTVRPGGGYQGSGFDFYQGTSMASPHVAGIAGLVYAASNSQITAQKVEEILYSTTHDFGKSKDANSSCVGTKPCGHGIVDAFNALKATFANYDVIFNAPSVAKVNATCAKSLNSFTDKDNHWSLVQGVCGAKYQGMPHTYQKDHQIYAQYDDALYLLKNNRYRQCEVIGVDGIGCYY